MTNEDIIQKIKNGLQNCCATYGIARQDIGIKISAGLMSGVNCVLLKDNTPVLNSAGKSTVISIKDLFGINAMEALLVGNHLGGTLSKLANNDKNKNITDKKKVNARMYSESPDFYPSVTLYEGDKVVNDSITIQDLT